MLKFIPFLLVFSLLCFFLFDDRQSSDLAFPPIEVDLDIFGLNLAYGDHGKKRFTVQAAGGQFVEAEDLVVFREPTIVFRDKNDKAVEIQAPYGELKRKNGKVLLNGTVQGSWENFQLEADRLIYTVENGVVFLRDAVRVCHPDFLLTCRQVELSPKKGTFQAHGTPQVLFHLYKPEICRRDTE